MSQICMNHDSLNAKPRKLGDMPLTQIYHGTFKDENGQCLLFSALYMAVHDAVETHMNEAHSTLGPLIANEEKYYPDEDLVDEMRARLDRALNAFLISPIEAGRFTISVMVEEKELAVQFALDRGAVWAKCIGFAGPWT